MDQNSDMGEGGYKSGQKMSTSFMDGPLVGHLSLSLKNTNFIDFELDFWTVIKHNSDEMLHDVEKIGENWVNIRI